MIALAFAWFAAASFAASLLYFLYAYLVVYGRPAAALDTASAIGVDVVLFSAFALHHSLFARTGLKRRIATLVSPALERAVYTLVASLLFFLVCYWWQPVPGELYTLNGWWAAVAYGVFATGAVVTLVSARQLDALELAGVRQVMESGHERAAAVTDLLTTGLYGLVRHPIYFGWILLVVGVPEMTMTRVTFAVVSTLYLAVAIPFEERSLAETFGPDYASYQEKVRWRMLPGVY